MWQAIGLHLLRVEYTVWIRHFLETVNYEFEYAGQGQGTGHRVDGCDVEPGGGLCAHGEQWRIPPVIRH